MNKQLKFVLLIGLLLLMLLAFYYSYTLYGQKLYLEASLINLLLVLVSALWADKKIFIRSLIFKIVNIIIVICLILPIFTSGKFALLCSLTAASISLIEVIYFLFFKVLRINFKAEK